MTETSAEVYGSSYPEYSVKAETEGRAPMPEEEWNALSSAFGGFRLDTDIGNSYPEFELKAAAEGKPGMTEDAWKWHRSVLDAANYALEDANRKLDDFVSAQKRPENSKGTEGL